MSDNSWNDVSTKKGRKGAVVPFMEQSKHKPHL